MKYLNEIEAYLNGTLDPVERKQFEEDCKTNNTLVEELAFYIQAKQATKLAKQKALNQRYEMVKPTFNWFRWLLIFIGALGIGAGLWYFFAPEEEPVLEFASLAEQQEQPNFLISGTTLSSNPATDNAIEQAIKLVENQAYDNAISLIDTIGRTDENYSKALEIQGYAHYQAQRYEMSISVFDNYLDQENGTNKLWAHWYQALAYLKLEQPEQANDKLNMIMETDYYPAKWREAANSLKSNIEKVR